ncbi:MAG: pyridoxamine 5'-phosphate oxidase family protein, partial [Polaromonas sp.]|nr:pyridoxamine 5'-phosphate oxidase family protein [Polaromonas sp.]
MSGWWQDAQRKRLTQRNDPARACARLSKSAQTFSLSTLLEPAMTHEPRLSLALRDLLAARRVAALGTLDAEQPELPFVSMVPFARCAAEASLVVHLSTLAPHTRNLLAHPKVSLMVMAAEVDGQAVHALPRVTLDAVAQVPARDSP